MMRTGVASVRGIDGLDRVDGAVRQFVQDCRHGRPDLEQYLGGSAEDSIILLAALVKADLRARFARDEPAAIEEYLDRYPRLREHDDRVISLIYEEFCLREEAGDRPDAEEFCDRYEPWKDSLASQLRYHRVLSQVAGTAPAVPRYPKLGTVFEGFLLQDELGRGGSARVYLAEQMELGGRLVALKISPDRGSEPAILGRLVHDHIIPVLTSAVEPDSRLRALCMPYKVGRPLDQVIRRLEPASRPRNARVIRDVLNDLPSPAKPDLEPIEQENRGWLGFPESRRYAEGVAWVGMKLAEALAYAHGKGVLHLDVKPANVLLTIRDGPQLLDFNLARDPHAATEAEAAVRGGTLPYMAPEQLEAFLDKERWTKVGEGADVYSLGLLLHEMLTGRPPDAQDVELPIARAINELLERRRALRPDLRRLNPKLPHALDAIIGRCIAFRPADRYASASQVAEDLRRFLEARPLQHAANPSRPERTKLWFRRHGRPLVVAVALVLGIAVVGWGTTLLQGPAENLGLRDGIAAYETHRYSDAVRLLTPLANKPDGAVAAFYLAASHLELNHLDQTVSPLSNCLSSAKNRRKLKRWGDSHPALASHADALARKLLALTRDQPKERADAMLPLAESVELVSVDIDGDRPEARIALVHIEEARQQYPKALAIIDGLIGEVRNARTEQGRQALLSYVLIRGRVLIRQAKHLLEQTAEASDLLARASKSVEASLVDLESIDASEITEDGKTHFEVSYFRILAHAVVGDVAARGSHKKAAGLRYRQALEIADKLIEDQPEVTANPYFNSLRKEVFAKAGEFRVAVGDGEARPAHDPPLSGRPAVVGPASSPR